MEKFPSFEDSQFKGFSPFERFTLLYISHSLILLSHEISVSNMRDWKVHRVVKRDGILQNVKKVGFSWVESDPCQLVGRVSIFALLF